jgi:hypothetical protein
MKALIFDDYLFERVANKKEEMLKEAANLHERLEFFL